MLIKLVLFNKTLELSISKCQVSNNWARNVEYNTIGAKKKKKKLIEIKKF